MQREAFEDAQITLKSFSAEASPRTPLGELTMLPDSLVDWGGGYPLPIFHPLDAFGVSLLGQSNSDAFGVSTPQTKSGYGLES